MRIPWVKRAKSFDELDSFHQFLAFGETIAHLECLQVMGEAASQESAGVIRWNRAGVP